MKMRKIKQEDFKKVADYFANLDFVELAYVFGSQVDAEIQSPRDLDIAILVPRKLSLKDRAKIVVAIREMLKIDKIDLVLLNEASSLLKFEVVKYGKLLFSCSDDVENNFEMKTIKIYHDLEFDRKRKKQLLWEIIDGF